MSKWWMYAFAFVLSQTPGKQCGVGDAVLGSDGTLLIVQSVGVHGPMSSTSTPGATPHLNLFTIGDYAVVRPNGAIETGDRAR